MKNNDTQTSFSDELLALFNKNNIPVELFHYTTIDSTNDEAKRLLEKGQSSPALLLADTQTKGKGRLGRTFFSSDQSGLYFSVLFPCIPFRPDFVTITSAASVIIEKAIRKYTDMDPKIKWVNDIYVDEKKVCGILCETVCSSESNISLIVGIGININTKSFPDDISDIAGSISLQENDKASFLSDIVSKLCQYIHRPDFSLYIDEYRKQSYVIGKSITFNQNNICMEATAMDIDSDGGLIVRLLDGSIRTLSTGEISIRTIS